jgi:hypothetical protein
MGWLQRKVRRCVEWVRGWLRPPELVLAGAAPTGDAALVLCTPPASRVDTCLAIRQETPPGIARLAALLAECSDIDFRAEGGLAGPAARGS